jgi:hypothetical protein
MHLKNDVTKFNANLGLFEIFHTKKVLTSAEDAYMDLKKKIIFFILFHAKKQTYP